MEKIADTLPGKADGTTWRNRIVGEGTEKPDQLLANPQNWRVHPKFQQDVLTSTLDQVGWIQRVIVNRSTGFIVDGHLRVTLAMRHGESEIPVSYIELTDEEEALVLATLDPIAGLAVADDAKLRELHEQIKNDDAAIQAMMDAIKEDAGIFEEEEKPDDPGAQVDRAEELREKWGVELGQLWALGEHRLVCGDCTDGDVVRMIADIPLVLMITDPPYGVKYDPLFRESALGAADRRAGTVVNDDDSCWKRAFDLFDGDVAYVWHADKQAVQSGLDLQLSGFEIRATIIWKKTHCPYGQGHYNYQHEPCWYAVKKGARSHWHGDLKQSTVWEFGLDETVDGGHGTQKPLQCMERPVNNHDGDVYDPFVGSGTTLIACERLNRKCRAIEISPAYCAVTIERFYQMTGIDPVLLSDG